jgi:xylulokinase
MPNSGRIDRSDGPAVIGIDVGTSSIRAIAFDAQGHKLAVASRRPPLKPMETGGEYDPDAVWDHVVAVLGEVGAALAGRPVAGMAVASIGESAVVVDEDGRALAPSIIWYDRRSEPQARAIIEAIGAERLFRMTGQAIDHFFTLPKLMWMREHWPAAMAKARHVLMTADWVAFRLSGEMATDPSLASRTLYYDVGEGRWSAEMLALAGCGADFPARLAASGTALGPLRPEVAAATGLAGAPVIGVGGHDHVVGAFATGLTEPGTVVNSVGTAEALLLATAGPLADAEGIRRGYVQGAIEGRRRMSYLLGGIFNAGGSLEWLCALLGNIKQETLIAEAERLPVGSHGTVFLPHLDHAPPPDPDPQARGAFLGLTPQTTPATLYRAALEGLAMQSRMMLDGMVSLPGVDAPREFRLIGGVSRNRLFRSIKANVFARPIIVVDEPEATALGAALLGGVAGGLFPSLEAALPGLDRTEFTIEPDGTAARYEALRAMVFEDIHARVRPINRGLDAFARGIEAR